MLRVEDILVHVGRCVGGTFVKLEHVPTGISRMLGPIGNTDMAQLRKQWLDEIETELREKGLTNYIVEEN